MWPHRRMSVMNMHTADYGGYNMSVKGSRHIYFKSKSQLCGLQMKYKTPKMFRITNSYHLTKCSSLLT